MSEQKEVTGVVNNSFEVVGCLANFEKTIITFCQKSKD